MQSKEKNRTTGLTENEKIVAAGKDNPNNGGKAFEAAEADMQNDADLRDKPEKGNELDEGELARLDGAE